MSEREGWKAFELVVALAGCQAGGTWWMDKLGDLVGGWLMTALNIPYKKWALDQASLSTVLQAAEWKESPLIYFPWLREFLADLTMVILTILRRNLWTSNVFI
ncbi:hypothetical protein Y1Q_0005572 [Alligator mississippiensis]|uniref:Uncharacterized protein n=1 Tax=Alligator mississippiensis TaxID=8496 RepID=A0A151MF14_ALLMI|nr:hypothetical protein Y1Q_0005572 [Alligator mississippiensis]